MIRKKAFYSLVSIVLSAVFMFTVFSSNTFKEPTAADVKLNGVTGKIYDFKDKIIDRFYNETEEKNVRTTNRKVYLGGYPIGLKLYADGVVVVGTEAVDTANGLVNPAEKAGIRVGDIIKKIDGKKVLSNNEVSSLIENSKGKQLEMYVLREEEYFTIKFCCLYSESEERYKAGIWIRDSSAGIGTVTFSTAEGLYASLGHPVCDIDTKKVLPISQGECTNVNLTGFSKGTSGSAGELSGFLESSSTGEVYYNGDLGVYGKFNQTPLTTPCDLASIDEVQTGAAKMYTSVENGDIQEYDIEIVRIEKNNEDNKHLTIKVTDRNLIEKTGGIVQGMSGSPIIQNGKLVGAVTHVFLNDPTGGYGIFAETMYETLSQISLKHLDKAS